jgi:predicted  nucleic acid-binding Zn-ribbon protein
MYLLEGAILLGLLGWNYFCYVASVLSDEDWGKLTGPHGVAFAAVVAVIVLWTNKLMSEREAKKEALRRELKEDNIRAEQEAARDVRHKEALATSEAHAETMREFLVKSLEVNIETKQAIADLTTQLKQRPCQLMNPIPDRIASKIHQKQDELKQNSNYGQDPS